MSPEEIIITACLLDNSLIPECCKNLSPETLCRYPHFWRQILEKYNKQESIDLIWGTEYARIHNLTIDFPTIASSIIPITDVKTAFKILQERKIQNDLNIIADRIKRKNISPHILLHEMQALIEKYTQQQEKQEINIDKIIDNCQNIKIKTGFPALDWIIKGITSEYIVLGGLSTHGKSMFVQNIAFNLLKNNVPVCYITAEMSYEQILIRLAIMHSGINPVMFKINEAEKKLFLDAVNEVKKMPFTVLSTNSFTDAKMEITKKQAVLYVIDYLQLFRIFDSDIKTEYQQLDYISKECLRLAHTCDICIFAISQFNRKGVDDIRKEALKGSSQLEQSADIVMLLYSPYDARSLEEKEEFKQRHGDNILNLGVEKNRNYALHGFIRLYFDRKKLLIKEINENEKEV